MKIKVYLIALLTGFSVMFLFQYCGNDKCEGIVCLNGGTCEKGLCKCTQGFTGDLCEIEVKPVSIKLTKIKIIGWPASNGGTAWDEYDGPDLYVKIKQGTTEIYKHHKSEYNVPEDKKFELIPLSDKIPVLDPDKEYTIELWDDDLDEGKNDQKLQVTTAFKPYQVNKRFPEVITVKSFLWDLQIELTLQYSW